MNLGKLQDVVSTRLKIGRNDASFPRVTQYIDETYREIMSKKGIGKRLRQKTVTFVTVANSPIAALPQATHRISNDIVDRLNRRVYSPMSLSDIRQRDPGQAYSTSAPFGYAVLGMSDAVGIDPSLAVLTVVSSDTADTGTTAYVEGVTSDGQSRSASVTLSGTTPATLLGIGLSSIATWTLITKFYITSSCKGYITLISSAVEIARIAPGHTYARYTRLYIYPTPTAILTLYADVELDLTPLVTTYDEPLLDEDFHWLLISGSLLKEYLRNGKFSEYDREMIRWKQGISDLRSHIQAPLGGSANARTNQWSQLGPDFPAGT